MEKVHQFLLELNRKFDHLRHNVLSMEPTPSLSKIFSLTFQEKQSFIQRNWQSPPSLEGAAFVARSDHKGAERTSMNKINKTSQRRVL